MRELMMRGFEDHATTLAAMTGASPDTTERAMPRRELLRALVRAHQRLVEHRLQSARAGVPPDPQSERSLAAIGERISDLLSSREARADAREERPHRLRETPEETR
jgi:hypothetical protein